MAWFKNLFGGLDQIADDDVNGLLTVTLFCLLDEGTRKNYRQWMTEQIVNSKATSAHDITLGVFPRWFSKPVKKNAKAVRQSMKHFGKFGEKVCREGGALLFCSTTRQPI